MLVTVADIKNYLNITSNERETTEANLSILADYASSAVESYCGRKFAADYVIEYHDGGRSSVFANRIPVNSVNSVLEFDGNEYVSLKAENIANNEIDVIWDEETGKFSRNTGYDSGHPSLDYQSPHTFLNFKKGVRIEYNGGYEEIPGDLKLATLDYIKLIYKKEQGISNMSFQGESRQKTGSSSGYQYSANWPPHIKRVLDLYKIY